MPVWRSGFRSSGACSTSSASCMASLVVLGGYLAWLAWTWRGACIRCWRYPGSRSWSRRLLGAAAPGRDPQPASSRRAGADHAGDHLRPGTAAAPTCCSWCSERITARSVRASRSGTARARRHTHPARPRDGGGHGGARHDGRCSSWCCDEAGSAGPSWPSAWTGHASALMGVRVRADLRGDLRARGRRSRARPVRFSGWCSRSRRWQSEAYLGTAFTVCVHRRARQRVRGGRRRAGARAGRELRGAVRWSVPIMPASCRPSSS